MRFQVYVTNNSGAFIPYDTPCESRAEAKIIKKSAETCLPDGTVAFIKEVA